MADQQGDPPAATLKERVEGLYRGRDRTAARFRYGLLALDIATITFFVIASALPETRWLLAVDFLIAVLLSMDFAARFWLAPNKLRHTFQFLTLADLLVLASLWLPLLIENLAFLRVVRALRLLRSHHLLRDLRRDSRYFAANEEVLRSCINLTIFIFVVTALVYVLQVDTNPAINNYVDALYFTVATLTTTGFGDITLDGSGGRLLAVIIMVVGIGLFLRLVQTIFRPEKVRHECDSCGLNRHDPDAVHCKHCGEVIKIETEGA